MGTNSRYRYETPDHERIGAGRTQSGAVLPTPRWGPVVGPDGATRSSNRRGGQVIAHGGKLSEEHDWSAFDAAFGHQSVQNANEAAMAPVAPSAGTGGEALTAPGLPAWLQAAGAGMTAAARAVPSAPSAGEPPRFLATSTGARALMPTASGARYVGTTDFGSVMEGHVPGWGSMTPEQRAASLRARPKSGAVVGQVTGRSGYETPRPQWMQTAAKPGQVASFVTPYGTASVSTPQTLLAARTEKAPMRAEGSAAPTSVSGAVAPDPKVDFLRRREKGMKEPTQAGTAGGLVGALPWAAGGVGRHVAPGAPAPVAPVAMPARHGGSPGGVDPLGKPVPQTGAIGGAGVMPPTWLRKRSSLEPFKVVGNNY